MNKKLTEIAYILDRSGSMDPLTEAAITGFNNFLKDQQETTGEANLTLALFDYEYLLHADRTPITEVRPLDTTTYQPRGSTALLDAIGRTIDNIGKQLAETPEKDRPGKVIIAIYTDGYENASTDYTAQQISKMIRHQTDNYQWEFLFLAANEDAIATAAAYGIDRKNASAVSYSVEGFDSSSASFSRKIRSSRNIMQKCATPEDLLTADADLSSIIEEESKKQSSHDK
ncbi:VWA domain-containing protein [Verrucomicrobiaceae bacterium N1E253]|uniref:VWA domain-containing protein n=1 Tax=Oceaniferula marina TaxID=2748318 RepID=A0A851GJF4_9BACT|nr:vWA domain-containing protein [Oceaniferula marina]NWK56001.1 VWA domain-containing protein [Oceaniferula marina]